MKLAGNLLAAAVVLSLTTPVAASTKEDIAALNERMSRMERVLESRGLMQVVQDLQLIKEELSQLRGQNEVLQHELTQLKSRQRELYLDMDRRLQGLEAGGVVSAPAAAGAAAVAGTAAATASKPPAQPATQAKPATSASTLEAERKAYKRSFELLKEGRYEKSATEFRAFLKKYPSSGYAANAQYWLGEAYYVSKKYSEALAEFKKVVKDYPQSSKIGDARLKLGFTYYELGNWEQARKTLQALSKDEKGSSIGRLADKRLKRMSDEGH
jgi:tol-pal system protein YbgF